MRIIIKAKNMEVSDYLKEVAEKKVGKLARYFHEDTDAHVTMSIEKSRHIVEVTIPMDSVMLRAEEATGDMYASIDGVLKKLERQIRKHRTKLSRNLHKDAPNQQPVYEYEDEVFEDLEVLKTKTYTIKPMSVEEAVMQLEMLHHSFFVFINSKTSEVNVIYERQGGKSIGLLEPESK